MNFVTEKEIIKKREENDDEEGNSDQQPDYRPLYERLKEVRDKKQLEWEEEHTLSLLCFLIILTLNLFRKSVQRNSRN